MATQVKARPPETAAAAVRAGRLGPRDVVRERKSDGTILLRAPAPACALPHQADRAARILGGDRSRAHFSSAAHAFRLAQAGLWRGAGLRPPHRPGAVATRSLDRKRT